MTWLSRMVFLGGFLLCTSLTLFRLSTILAVSNVSRMDFLAGQSALCPLGVGGRIRSLHPRQENQPQAHQHSIISFVLSSVM
jgi:hypothetical protein